MAIWDQSITDINEGTAPNNGSGDSIRDAFYKVDSNFQSINNFLSSPSIDFINANVNINLAATNASLANLVVANVYGTTTFTGGNVRVSGDVLPTEDGVYNLGGPGAYFANIYVKSTISTNQITQSSDAGILKIHANASVGDLQDTGILGNISSDYDGASTYCFFGHQYTTNDFIYKITDNDATHFGGNNIVVGGIYGNVHFGGGLFSNATASSSTTTGALIVSGGAGVGKDLYVGGNVYSGSYPVLTTANIGYYGTLLSGGIVTGSARFVSAEPATSTSSGALAITNGGLGVYGNIVAGGILGPYYGNVANPIQTGITTLGTLGNLTVTNTTQTGSLQATTLGVGTATITSTLNLSGATVTNLASLNTAGNISASGLIGSYYGTIQTAAQPNITSVGTLTGINISGNVTTGNVIANTAIYCNNYKFANGAPFTFISTTIANTSEITANVSSGTLGLNLTTTGVTAGTYGSATSIPTIVVDNKGRITSVTANSVSTSLTLTGNTGSGSVAGGGTLTIGGTRGMTVSAAGSTFTVNTPQDLQISASPTYAGIFVTGTVNAATVQATTIGNTGATLTGTLSTNAQTNITSVGTLTGLTVSGTIAASTNNNINIGAVGATFANIYATNFNGVATTAKYADLAENYVADDEYDPGTVVIFGGDSEITVTEEYADERVAGVISTNPAYLMNSEAEGLPVALRGRVPVKVFGPVNKGDSLVTHYKAGYAISIGRDRIYGQAVFAKSLETNTDPGTKVIIAVIL